jgi:purine-binding chemotaxis protein CheW
LWADPPCVLLVFDVSSRAAALPLEDVKRIVPIAQLARPPGLPSVLEGVLNLGGTAVPVLRLDRLLGLPPRDPDLYSAVILLKSARILLQKNGALPETGGERRGRNDGPVALLVDRVREVLRVPQTALLPVHEEDSFNGCARAAVSVSGENKYGQYIHVLSFQRLLLEKEALTLSEFQAMAQDRLQYWEAEAR